MKVLSNEDSVINEKNNCKLKEKIHCSKVKYNKYGVYLTLSS